MNYKKTILEKITNNTEVVGIIGLGYVGLPLAVNFAEALATPNPSQNPDAIGISGQAGQSSPGRCWHVGGRITLA